VKIEDGDIDVASAEPVRKHPEGFDFDSRKPDNTFVALFPSLRACRLEEFGPRKGQIFVDGDDGLSFANEDRDCLGVRGPVVM
jgi:hypothetical protein